MCGLNWARLRGPSPARWQVCASFANTCSMHWHAFAGSCWPLAVQLSYYRSRRFACSILIEHRCCKAVQNHIGLRLPSRFLRLPPTFRPSPSSTHPPSFFFHSCAHAYTCVHARTHAHMQWARLARCHDAQPPQFLRMVGICMSACACSPCACAHVLCTYVFAYRSAHGVFCCMAASKVVR